METIYILSNGIKTNSWEMFVEDFNNQFVASNLQHDIDDLLAEIHNLKH